MRKSYISYLRFPVFFIMLVLLGLIPERNYAQSDNAPLFALIECMKVSPEQEDTYLNLEKTIWKPLHQARADQGNIFGWYLYRVRFTGTNDAYNYVTVTLFTDPKNVEDPWLNIDPARILAGKDLDKAMNETLKSREMVSSVLNSRQGYVYPEGGPGEFKYLQLDFMKVKQGNDEMYLNAELNTWKPVHNEFIKAGSRAGWSLWGRVFPSGYSMDYQYVTVNYFANWAQIGTADYGAAFSKAHPGKDAQPLMDKTNDSRVLVKSELWEVVEKIISR